MVNDFSVVRDPIFDIEVANGAVVVDEGEVGAKTVNHLVSQCEVGSTHTRSTRVG